MGRLDIAAVQRVLRAEHLDGWLLYDFHGSNPIATHLAELDRGGHMTTRRWFYLIPATGEPLGLVHAIERHNLDALPGEKQVYAGRDQLERGLASLLAGRATVAMEYSANCAIPYLARVDAGTIELVRACGTAVVSSGDLVQHFAASWDQAQLASHRTASAALYRIKDRAFAEAHRALVTGTPLTEYDLQQRMVRWFEEEGLVSDSPPVVAVGPHAGDPHYLPGPTGASAIVPDTVLLLDLWGKTSAPRAVFADITWVAATGAVQPRVTEAFAAIVRARDAAMELVASAAAAQRDLRGWEVDRAARAVIEDAGFGPQILHRTGHSLGESVHGNGANLDDYETHDDRRLLPGAGFTIEPGVYFEDFGVRTEINMYRGTAGAEVTGERQMHLVQIGR